MTEEGRGLIEQLKQKLGLGTGGLRPGESYEDAIVDVVEPFVVDEVKFDKSTTQRLQREKINTYFPKKPPQHLISEQERVVSHIGTVAQLQQSIQRVVDRSPAGTNKKKRRVEGKPVEVNYTGVYLIEEFNTSSFKGKMIQPKDQQGGFWLLAEVIGVRNTHEEGEIELILREGEVRKRDFFNAGELHEAYRLNIDPEDPPNVIEMLLRKTEEFTRGKIDAVQYVLGRSPKSYEQEAKQNLVDGLLRGDVVLHGNKQSGRDGGGSWRDHFTMFERRPEKRGRTGRIETEIISQEQIDKGKVTLVVPEALLRQS